MLLNIFPLLCVIKVLLPYIIKEQDHVPVPVLALIGNLLSVPTLMFILIPFCMKDVGLAPWAFGKVEPGSKADILPAVTIILWIVFVCVLSSYTWPHEGYAATRMD